MTVPSTHLRTQPQPERRQSVREADLLHLAGLAQHAADVSPKEFREAIDRLVAGSQGVHDSWVSLRDYADAVGLKLSTARVYAWRSITQNEGVSIDGAWLFERMFPDQRRSTVRARPRTASEQSLGVLIETPVIQ